MTKAVYEVCIDFDDDGDYLDAGEDVTSKVRWPVSWVRGMENQLEMAQASSLELYLKDTDGTYSPENDANVKPGRSVRLRGVHASTTYDIWYGKIAKVIPHPRSDEQVT